MKKWTRLWSAMLMVGAALCPSPATAAEKNLKALLITGGCCHDYDNQRIIIPEAINSKSKLKVEWTIVHQFTKEGNALLEFYKNPDWAKGYDVVFHNECFANVGDEAYVKGILKPHLDGTPAVLIHCSMHCYRTGPAKENWWEFCGVHSPNHGPQHVFDVNNVAPEHEIMKGLANWTTPIKEELYSIAKKYPTMTPLAESKCEKSGNMYCNVWVNSYGPKQTKVFATTIGHGNATMLDEDFQKLLTRGFLWAVGKPVEENMK